MERRVVLVTGAARGIGAATVRRLVADGHRVVAVDSCMGVDSELSYPLATRDDLDRVVQDAGEAAVGHVADVRDIAGLRAAVAIAVEAWGRLDAAVAAAGVIAGGNSLWESDDDLLQLMWDVNVRGVWNTARASVPVMIGSADTADSARFVAVASAAGTFGLHHLAAYNASKHAVVGLVKGLAADLVGTGAGACAVSPGSTDTEMLRATAHLYGLPDSTIFASNQLLRRILTPAEVASTVAYCCSPDSVVNGSVVHADGGFAP
jgi:SDR family mycofactocin-dependent oxidoreductase